MRFPSRRLMCNAHLVHLFMSHAHCPSDIMSGCDVFPHTESSRRQIISSRSNALHTKIPSSNFPRCAITSIPSPGIFLCVPGFFSPHRKKWPPHPANQTGCRARARQRPCQSGKASQTSSTTARRERCWAARPKAGCKSPSFTSSFTECWLLFSPSSWFSSSRRWTPMNPNGPLPMASSEPHRVRANFQPFSFHLFNPSQIVFSKSNFPIKGMGKNTMFFRKFMAWKLNYSWVKLDVVQLLSEVNIDWFLLTWVIPFLSFFLLSLVFFSGQCLFWIRFLDK